MCRSFSETCSFIAWMRPDCPRAFSTWRTRTVDTARSLQRLAASESRYRALMEHANDAILILDPTAKILEVNRQAERLLGARREELVGRSYDEFVVSDERAESARRQEELRAE